MKVITSVVNTDFIEIQFLSFKRFLKNDFEFIVFNDAKNFKDSTNNFQLGMKQNVFDLCNKLNITCINHDNDFHINLNGASFRHASVLNKMLQFQLNNPDKYLYVDSDIFLIDYLDIHKYNDFPCAVVLQYRFFNNSHLHYIWPGLCYFDMSKIVLPHLLNWNLQCGCDTGGMTMQWLISQNRSPSFPSCTDIRHSSSTFHNQFIYFIKHLWSCTWNIDELPTNLYQYPSLISFLRNDPRNNSNLIFAEIYDDVFLHLRSGSSYNDLPSFLLFMQEFLKN